MNRAQRRINTNPLQGLDLSILDADPNEMLMEAVERVEYIAAELIRPDPAQPRRILPEKTYTAFHSERLTPTQALRELVHIAQVTARQNGRPFDGVLDLLPSSDYDAESDDEAAAKLSPEEHLLRDLVNLAVTIRDDGQVNPITVIDISEGATRLFRIETGERRYWAHWLIRDFIPGYDGDGTIPCILVPSGRISAFRQAKENTARAGLSAVAMARQAALLLLAAHGYEIPSGPLGNDFYRQACSLDLRNKRDYTGKVLSAMGGITKGRFRHYKSLLQLGDEAMEIADRHEINEGILREIVSLAPDEQAEVLRHVIQFGLTVKQVKDMLSSQTAEVDEDEQQYPKAFRQLLRASRESQTMSGADLFSMFAVEEGNTQVAYARLWSLYNLINDALQAANPPGQ